MSVAATFQAAQECARTLLFDSLCIHKFSGAIPHVMLVMDAVPCTLQKVLTEGYRRAMETHNGLILSHAQNAGLLPSTLRFSLSCSFETPCGAAQLFPAPSNPASTAPSGSHVAYTIMPFVATDFKEDVARLQHFFRLCGSEAAENVAHDDFLSAFRPVAKYLLPLKDESSEPEETKGEETEDEKEKKLFDALRNGPPRELLAFILIQRSAFQNELQQYRLRLSLFDRGMRVIEHCHLNSMSEPADNFARMSIVCSTLKFGRMKFAPFRNPSGLEDAALSQDQIYSYCRSCSFSPVLSEPFAKAIADCIDFHAWSRDKTQLETLDSIPVPPSLALILKDESSALWQCFSPDCLSFAGIPGSQLREILKSGDSPRSVVSLTEEAFHDYLESLITGVGAPLKIIGKDPTKVLTFAGGLEDCLANTGMYPAGWSEVRNDVTEHRKRFATVDKNNSNSQNSEEPMGEPAAPVQGKLKKKEYLEKLRQEGLKPSKVAKRQTAGKCNERQEEEEGVRLARRRDKNLERGSCIATSIGGTFPIGEVITESFDFSKLSGVCDIFAYPDSHKNVSFSEPRPFQITVEEGKVVMVSDDAPSDFVDLWTLVKQTEQDCYVRELGIGLNPFLSLQHVLADVTSFERQWGIHLSLGLRHPLFVKQKQKMNPDGVTPAAGVEVKGPVVKRKAGKYHIDVFVAAAKLTCGEFEMDFSVPLVAQ